MIETFKILTAKYDNRATPTMLGASSSVTRGHNLRLNKFINMIYVNTTLLLELLMHGIVYLVLLSLQILQIVSKIDLTTFGRTMILSIIIKQTFTEPETEMKWYLILIA